MKVTAKHKYTTMGFVYILGLICASFLDSIVCFILAGLLAVLFAVLYRRSSLFLKLYIFVAAAAFLVFGVCRVAYIDSCQNLIGGKGRVCGTVTECRDPDNDTVCITVSGTVNGRDINCTLFSADAGITAGDKVEFDAIFSAFSDSAEFSESSYYFTKRIFLKSYAVSEITVTDSESVRGVVSYISGYFKDSVDDIFSERGGGIIKAMFFGDKSDLSDNTRTDIKRSGIAHLTAVSGMHLSIMVHMFAGILSVFFRRGGRRYFMIIAAYIVFLMLFFGMTASVMRSGFMMIVFYGSQLVYRKSDTMCSVGAALMIILLLNPFACRDAGLALSVLGTIGVGVIAPVAAEALKIRRFGILGRSMFPSLCASLCTMPVGAVCFGGVSFAAPVTVLLMQPFFTVILILVPLAVVLPFLSAPVLLIAGWSARIMEIIASFISNIPVSYTETDNLTVILFVVFLTCGTIAAGMISGRTKYMVISASLTTVAFAAALALYGIISFNDIRISIAAGDKSPVVAVEDRTGVCFYMLSDDSNTAGVIYEKSAGSDVNFVCVSEEAVKAAALAESGGSIHFPPKGNTEYNISGLYSVIVNNGEIFLDIRGITVGILPAGSESSCDIAVYGGYKENYGKGGNSATILCDKKYYNCGEAVNAFLHKTEIIIDAEGRYALCVQ